MLLALHTARWRMTLLPCGSKGGHDFILSSLTSSFFLCFFPPSDVEPQVHYDDPGVQLHYPPAWVNLTGTTEEKAHGFNLTIPVGVARWPRVCLCPRCTQPSAGCMARMGQHYL